MPELATPHADAELATAAGSDMLDRQTLLHDYRIGWRSRHASVIGRREVMSGKAKFGIFGDGKELAQLAMAHFIRPGDHRSGYYRDQTIMLATGTVTLPAFFAQLYAHADPAADPASGGRAMNAHFGTRYLDDAGRWHDQLAQFNVASDISPTGSQMPRLVGLAYASRLYRELPELAAVSDGFSEGGREVAWGTIGNATCAEGLFWEAVNAVGVLGGPLVLSIWDDGYGISVPNRLQVTNGDLSALLSGFGRAGGEPAEPLASSSSGHADVSRGSDQPSSSDQPDGAGEPGGYQLFTVRGWDYPALLDAYAAAAAAARDHHVPAIVHVTEVTQPQGHSTSGSHERYKSPERLAWETEYDPLHQMRRWLLTEGHARADALDAIEEEERLHVEAEREAAWRAYLAPLEAERDDVVDMLDEVATAAGDGSLTDIRDHLARLEAPLRRDLHEGVRRALAALYRQGVPEAGILRAWRARSVAENKTRYGSHLYSASARAARHVPIVPPEYAEDAPMLMGFEVLNACFDAALARDPRVIAFGEDVGRIGDVNQGFRGLQGTYGPLRVSDTGIREATIIGQGIGMAMRGLRPIAEIQYLDYVLYALQILSDDLATLQWRTHGGQKAPVIVRTRGHRLEGIWHSGSPMAGIIHLVRGMHVCVPRDMTRAAGFYNLLLQSDEPALVVEVLNGYRVREPLPANIGELTVPLGVPEVLREGGDVTVVTYGACCRIVLEAAAALEALGVDVEVVDVQTLLPFDVEGRIGASLRKTGRIVFVDEDVPGGTTAYMLRDVIERQGGYQWLDAPPITLSAAAHRPAYGSDGDYFSKPNVEDILAAVLDLMAEADPRRFPPLYD